MQNVLDSIRLIKRMDFWLEIVTLVVPDFNDSDDELTEIAEFIAGVSCDIPWHVTAFRPDYKMTEPGRTPVETLLRAYEIGKGTGLKFVYPGNVHGGVGSRESTHCPSCDRILIRRKGFVVEQNRMKKGACSFCDTSIPGVWEQNPPDHTQGDGIPLPVTTIERPCG